MRLLHPFMPFISEEIWQRLPVPGEALVTASWPKSSRDLHFPDEAAEASLVQETIRAVRNLRSQISLPPGRQAPVILRPGPRFRHCLEQERSHISRLAFADPLTIDPEAARPQQALAAIVGEELEIYLPLAGVIDLEKELARLNKELDQVSKDLRRSEGKLNSDGFRRQAPPAVVEKERARREELRARLGKLQKRIEELS